MGPLHPNIVLGTATARTEVFADIGREVFVSGNMYRLVRAATTIATAANKTLILPAITATGGTTFSASGGASGQAVITTASTTGVTVGQLITGTGIPTVPGGVFVIAVVANTSVTISASLTATASGTYTVTNTNYLCTTTTTAASPAVAGVVPAGQVGSTGTTSLIAGDFFYIQVGGIATPIITATGVAAGTGLTTGTTAGECAAVSATYAATTPGALFAATIQTGSGVASTATPARLQNLI